MYRGFNIKKIKFDNKSTFAAEYDKKHPNMFYSKVLGSIESFLQSDYRLDGNALIKEWFPVTNNKLIFISHSRDDCDLAKALAYWLEKKFQITSFIDSSVWGDFRQLRQKINSYLKKTLGAKYDFYEQDRVSQHIFVMLNNSLMEMMDRCQCMFLLNTPNSVTVNELFQNSVYSPWIFSEIGMFNCIEKKYPPSIIQEEKKGIEQFSRVSYKVDLSRFTTLTADDLNTWCKECKKLNKPQQRLNKLYELHPEEKVFNYFNY